MRSLAYSGLRTRSKLINEIGARWGKKLHVKEQGAVMVRSQ